MRAETYTEAVLAGAMSLVGAKSVRYRRGQPELGQSPRSGFDCSGFVRYVLLGAGLTIPDFIGADSVRRPVRHANEFWDHYGIAVQPGLQRGGDLLFTSRHGRFPTHIGIVRDEETYIHAPGVNGSHVSIERIEECAIQPVGRGRTLYNVNPIGYKAITVALDAPDYRYHQKLPES